MTRIKLCGLTRECDIQVADMLSPEYIGFVFAKKSRRYVSPKKAKELKQKLSSDIKAVGVFVNEDKENILKLINEGIIDIIQLHGNEDESYIKSLRELTDKPIIKAFRIDNEADIIPAQNSTADYVLLDSKNGGSGEVFNWNLIKKLHRPYFLAGGLNVDNVKNAVDTLCPFAVDVSSGIETDGLKDKAKMTEFVNAVRNVYGKEDIK